MKKLLLIASIFLVTTVSTSAQGRSNPNNPSPTVLFYPNPASTTINFDFKNDYEQGYSIQIFNAILGRKMYELANVPERMSVNLNDYSRGIYIFQVRDKNGRMAASGKFQVAK